MRLTEIGDKEIVDLANGSMHALLVPDFEGSRAYLKEDLQLPWKSIIIVGEDTIIFRSC